VLHILPKKNDMLFNCFDGCVISVLAWFRRDYPMMDLKSWELSYDRDRLSSDQMMSSLLNYQWDLRYELLEHYHGLKLVRYWLDDPQQRLTIIKEELSNKRPVIMVIDSYWCPWDEVFQSVSHAHFCIVIGMDEAKEILYCMDPFYMKEVETLTFDEFYQSALKTQLPAIVTFESTSEEMKINERMGANILIQTLQELLQSGTFDSIRKFAADVPHYFSIEQEVKSFKNIEDAPILRRTYERKRYTHRFMDTVHYLVPRGRHSALDQTVEALLEGSVEWEIVKTMFVKCSFMSNPQKQMQQMQQIADKMVYIADREQALAMHMLSCLESSIQTMRA
jgi:hypothetical protein